MLPVRRYFHTRLKRWLVPSSLLRAIRALFYRLAPLLDGLLLLSLPPRVDGAKVLVIRLDAIGDFVLWLDAARALVKRYHLQGYSVVLLGNKVWAGWAREMGVADEVWDLDVNQFCNRYFYRWQWLRRIRQAGFRIAIETSFLRIFLTGDSLVRASGAVERIGSAGDQTKIIFWSKSWSDRWYTRLIPASPVQLMELKRNAEFMRGLGFTDFRARRPSIPQAQSGITDRLPRQPYAVLAPTAGWDGREWPLENFIEIGQRFAALGLNIVVVGSPADRERVSGLLDALSGKTVDLVGSTTLSELAEVLRHATVVLTNETGTLHIGAAVGAPVVCILGGGHYGRFVPYEIEVPEESHSLPIIVAEPMPCYGCDWICKYPRKNSEAVKCIQDISIEKVWASLEMALSERKKLIEGKNTCV